MRRRVVMGAVGVAAAAGGAALAWWRLPAGEIALPANFWTLRFARPEGGDLAFQEMRQRPLLINFWATWCAPCLRELPLLNQFQQQHAASGWQVVGLAIDSPSAVREFLSKRPLGYPVGLAGLDGTALARSLGNDAGGLPFSVFVDESGRVRDRKLGALAPEELARWATLRS